MDLNGKVVLITGSTGELGTSVTMTFLGKGATVIGLGSRQSSLEDLRSKLNVNVDRFSGLVVDVLDASSIGSAVDNVVENHRGIDVLINLVGGFVGGSPLHETSEEKWDKMMALNAKSVFLCMKKVLPQMFERKSGRIINVGGKGGVQATTGTAAYSASKAAVINLTQTVAAEGRENNITANVVIPSIIDTKANRDAMPEADFGRWVTPDSVAKVIVFLCSEEAKDISGAVIPVYGRS
ncbi:SDR family oxidoreductase [bacterium]|nr:SDR family oxidoreductase [bacterium]